MGRSAKVAVTIDEDLLAQAEAVRRRTGESRSAVFARALRELFGAEGHRRRVDEYVKAYREHPEDADEIAFARRQSKRALAKVPWEEG